MSVEAIIEPTRPVVRYHGGKWLLAPWIIEHFPPHHTYTEAFGGGGSVLLRKPRAYSEVYNDLYDEIVTLFRVLRDPLASARLIECLRLTPFARVEFFDAYGDSADPVEIARRLIVRSFMGFGSDGFNRAVRTGFRADTTKSGTTPAHDWRGYPDTLALCVERLRGVVIEHRPAIDVVAKHDGAATLHYIDPPYLPETRSDKSRKSGERYHAYCHEMTREDHIALLDVLHSLKGMVVLSGYPSHLYDAALGDWQRIERRTLAAGARERIEVLWLNPACVAALDRRRAQMDMFA